MLLSADTRSHSPRASSDNPPVATAAPVVVIELLALIAICGAFSVPLVRIGDKFDLYGTLEREGPMTSSALAQKTGLAERYLREWLSAQAASNYLAFDPADGTFSLPPEQAMVFANEDSPVYMMGAFECIASNIQNQGAIGNTERQCRHLIDQQYRQALVA